MIKVLSLDLQGTLSDANFSDYFWLEFLPIKYANKFNISREEAKVILKQKFKDYGVYNKLYYDDAYWSKELDFDTLDELKKFNIQPKINDKLYNFIKTLNIPVIILSTTTDIFIDYELKDVLDIFYKKYSCLDYFGSGGKTKEVFDEVCRELCIKNEELLHVGDSMTMDIENGNLAGVQTIYYDGDTDKLIEEIKKRMEV